jgi:transposase
VSRAKAQALKAQGASRREIAERLGATERTVGYWLRRPATFPPRSCGLCGARFVPTNGRQRFCSVEHWEQHRRGGPNRRRCRLCGISFIPTSGGQRYCTPEHRAEHERRHRQPQTTEAWRQRVQQLEAELARAREQLARREAACRA